MHLIYCNLTSFSHSLTRFLSLPHTHIYTHILYHPVTCSLNSNVSRVYSGRTRNLKALVASKHRTVYIVKVRQSVKRQFPHIPYNWTINLELIHQVLHIII